MFFNRGNKGDFIILGIIFLTVIWRKYLSHSLTLLFHQANSKLQKTHSRG